MTFIPVSICPITGLQATDCNVLGSPQPKYTISVVSPADTLIILPAHFDILLAQPFLASNKHIIAGAILNRIFSDNRELGLIQINLCDLDNFESDIQTIISKLSYPSTPQERLDNLLSTLIGMQDYEGQDVEFLRYYSESRFYYRHYIKSREELNFYMHTLFEAGYIQTNSVPVNYALFQNYRISYKGLNYYLQQKSAGKQSNKCFIAMAFVEEMRPFRAAIKQAIIECGYVPVIIDEVHYESDQTINDAIISQLRAAKFCVADFTFQRRGVYFESGFALGQNKQVIYTCKNDDFNNSHFDVNHFPHIIYNDPDELRNKLVDKIKAWVL